MLTKHEEDIIKSFEELFNQQGIIADTMKDVSEVAKSNGLDVALLKKIAKARVDRKIDELREKTQNLLDKLD
jgi:uncharacterized protein (UPF0335 family)